MLYASPALVCGPFWCCSCCCLMWRCCLPFLLLQLVLLLFIAAMPLLLPGQCSCWRHLLKLLLQPLINLQKHTCKHTHANCAVSVSCDRHRD